MRAFGALAAEAVRDAVRRRSLLAAALLSVLAALAVNRCSGCQGGVVLQGEALAPSELGAVTTLASFGLLALWSYALAALLASDGLAAALEDGTAASVLARPVSRDVLCLARLGGALGAALAVGLALLALAALLLHGRQGLGLAPAAAATFAVALGAWSAAALAMALSLALPRPATLLVMTAVGGAACAADLWTWLGEGSALWGLVGRFGPGWLSAPLAPLAAWLPPLDLPPPPPLALLRSAGWGAAATGALLLAFRRLEIGR